MYPSVAASDSVVVAAWASGTRSREPARVPSDPPAATVPAAPSAGSLQEVTPGRCPAARGPASCPPSSGWWMFAVVAHGSGDVRDSSAPRSHGVFSRSVTQLRPGLAVEVDVRASIPLEMHASLPAPAPRPRTACCCSGAAVDDRRDSAAISRAPTAGGQRRGGSRRSARPAGRCPVIVTAACCGSSREPRDRELQR